MNLHKMLLEREHDGRPIRVGMIGAGKFGGMFLSQARRTDGMHLMGLAEQRPTPTERDVSAYVRWSLDHRIAHTPTLVTFARAYPGRTALTFLAVLLASTTEGLSLGTALPLLAKADEGGLGGGLADFQIRGGLDPR